MGPEENAIYIRDNVSDILAAREVGIPMIAVLGGRAREILEIFKNVASTV